MADKFVGKKDIFMSFKVWDVQDLTALWLDDEPFSPCWDAAMCSSIDARISADADQSRLLRDKGLTSEAIHWELVESADNAAYCG